MIKLSPRLQAVARLIPQNSIVADIGTDHALLPIYLIQNSIATKVYAVDNKPGPLEMAKENLNYHQITDVKIILQDGIKHLPKDCNVIVICGLGSATILDILNEGETLLSSNPVLIIQSNVGMQQIRQWSSDKQWQIVHEELIKDNGIIYEVIKLAKGSSSLSNKEILFGPLLLKNKNELFVELWQGRRSHFVTIYSKLPRNSVKRNEYLAQIQLISEQLENEKELL